VGGTEGRTVLGGTAPGVDIVLGGTKGGQRKKKATAGGGRDTRGSKTIVNEKSGKKSKLRAGGGQKEPLIGLIITAQGKNTPGRSPTKNCGHTSRTGEKNGGGWGKWGGKEVTATGFGNAKLTFCAKKKVPPVVGEREGKKPKKTHKRGGPRKKMSVGNEEKRENLRS